MSFNPFKERTNMSYDQFYDWKDIAVKPYDKNTVDPYTKTRIILMNGTEFERVWFGHNFTRNCNNNELRRDLAIIRRGEQQQQKRISALKPLNETILETTISYEQLAVDLTAWIALNEPNESFKKALDFALLEDFDHLYRYATLLEMEQNVHAERLVGGYTEIMPGRPTIAEHRHPAVEIKKHLNSKTCAPISMLHACTITAAEQQTMNYYMNVAGYAQSELSRQLYTEIGMIEEQHVSMYGSFIDTMTTPLEKLLMHEYGECYLYYSCFVTETDANIKAIWEQHLMQEIAHLNKAVELLNKYDRKDWQEVIPNGEFPNVLKLKSNKEYVRNVIKNTVYNTTDGENYLDISKLPDNFVYFKYQYQVCPQTNDVASHVVIQKSIEKNGTDYRYEDSPHPIPELGSRKSDNTKVGRNQ